MSSEIQILDITPDSLIFQFSERAEKMVPVVPELTLKFEKQYMQVSPFIVEPDSVRISGPKLIIDTIQQVFTEPAMVENVSSPVENEYNLSRISKVEMDPSEVWVRVQVEKFTEASMKVPIEVINLPDSLVLRAFPAQVTVSFQVGMNAYKTLNEHFFRAVVDYAEAGTMLANTLQVKLVRMPDYIQSVNYTPKTVEYILEK